MPLSEHTEIWTLNDGCGNGHNNNVYDKSLGSDCGGSVTDIKSVTSDGGGSWDGLGRRKPSYSDDSLLGGSGRGGRSNKGKNNKSLPMDDVAAQEHRAVIWSRIILMSVLFGAVAGMSYTIHRVIARNEHDVFENQVRVLCAALAETKNAIFLLDTSPAAFLFLWSSCCSCCCSISTMCPKLVQ